MSKFFPRFLQKLVPWFLKLSKTSEKFEKVTLFVCFRLGRSTELLGAVLQPRYQMHHPLPLPLSNAPLRAATLLNHNYTPSPHPLLSNMTIVDLLSDLKLADKYLSLFENNSFRYVDELSKDISKEFLKQLGIRSRKDRLSILAQVEKYKRASSTCNSSSLPTSPLHYSTSTTATPPVNIYSFWPPPLLLLLLLLLKVNSQTTAWTSQSTPFAVLLPSNFRYFYVSFKSLILILIVIFQHSNFSQKSSFAPLCL